VSWSARCSGCSAANSHPFWIGKNAGAQTGGPLGPNTGYTRNRCRRRTGRAFPPYAVRDRVAISGPRRGGIGPGGRRAFVDRRGRFPRRLRGSAGGRRLRPISTNRHINSRGLTERAVEVAGRFKGPSTDTPPTGARGKATCSRIPCPQPANLVVGQGREGTPRELAQNATCSRLERPGASSDLIIPGLHVRARRAWGDERPGETRPRPSGRSPALRSLLDLGGLLAINVPNRRQTADFDRVASFGRRWPA